YAHCRYLEELPGPVAKTRQRQKRDLRENRRGDEKRKVGMLSGNLAGAQMPARRRRGSIVRSAPGGENMPERGGGVSCTMPRKLPARGSADPRVAEVPLMDIVETIKEQIANNTILLYMKGSPNAPQCGFSSRAAQAVM